MYYIVMFFHFTEDDYYQYEYSGDYHSNLSDAQEELREAEEEGLDAYIKEVG